MMCTQIKDGTQTRYAEQQMTALHDVMPSVEYIIEMGKNSPFLRKLFARMAECGYQGKRQNTTAAFCFLKDLCDEAGVNISRQTLSNWLKEGKVAHNTTARENVYKLCFALKMNAQQTEEFFLKGYLARPFNYKSLYETVCYFCLYHHEQYRYADVERIKSIIESTPPVSGTEPPEFTVMIRSSLKACNTESDLIEYWRQQSTSFGMTKYTAKSEVESLLKRCYEVVPKDQKRRVKKPSDLLEIIFNYRARREENGERKYRISIAKSNLPDCVKQNFPDPQKIWKILSDLENNTDKSTDDMLRKAIIVLNFYAFFADYDRRTKEPKKYGQPHMRPFEAFTEQMNLCLERCGYVRLYWQNPFDWMFGYCAKQRYPLIALKEIIKVSYLDNCNNEILSEEDDDE